MDEFPLVSGGVPATWDSVWTGDVQARGVCVSYDYFGCCQQGVEIKLIRTTVSGGPVSDWIVGFGATTTCFRSQDTLAYWFGATYRVTDAEIRIRNAASCQDGTVVDFKLALDLSCGCNSSSSTCCQVAFDPIQLV